MSIKIRKSWPKFVPAAAVRQMGLYWRSLIGCVFRFI